ncbi:MAG: PIG-L family deacetylase, partial [Acidobacteriota bacterium]
AVRAVRLARPLVLTSVFIGGSTDGHGNHQTVGQITQEVFNLAGDPNAFPEHMKQGLRPWLPLKTYGRVPGSLMEGKVDPKGLYNYATGKWEEAGAYNYVEKRWVPGAVTATVQVPVGDYDPVLGQSYVQIAREGLGLQKCQTGGASVPQSGDTKIAYHRFGSRVSSGSRENSYFDGIDISLAGIATLAGDGDPGFLKQGLGEIHALVEKAVRGYSAHRPEQIASTLAAGLKATNDLIRQVEAGSLSDQAKYDVTYELKVKQSQFNRALIQALGLDMQATVAPDTPSDPRMAAFRGMPETFQTAIPGQQFGVRVHINNRSKVPVQVTGVSLIATEDRDWQIQSQGRTSGALSANQPMSALFKVGVSSNPTYTRPYFTRPHIEQAYYDIHDERYLNLSYRPYPLEAWVECTYEGAPVRMGQVVQTVKRITGPGTIIEPLVVGPAISVSIAPRAGAVPLDAKSFKLTATIRSNVKGPARGSVRLEMPQGWRSNPASAEFSTARDGENQSVVFEVLPAALQEKAYEVTAVASYGGKEHREGYKTIGYTGLRPYNLYRPSGYHVNAVDVKVAPDITVGYIMGSGDEVPKSLENLGINVSFLSEQDLASGNLRKFDVILLGVRAYAAREDVAVHNGRLLEYVNGGGVVVVQYNTPEYDHNYGPYPYEMGSRPEEVTDEASQVQILAPGNPVFTWPNKITARDFEGWVEERGSKFLRTWDPRYEALLETQDAGQEPQKGGMLYARYGKGVYIYCAYAFYRQLPEGVPGAFRLIANMMSLPRNPQVAARPGN